MAKPRILIVADDASLRATLARWLLGAGYAVELAESARRARDVIASESVNLAIVGADTDLAREIAERIKRVVLVPQPGQDGAFSEQELLDRVRTELEPASATTAQDGPQLLSFGGYTLDAEARSLLDPNGQDVTLTRAEFSLLLAFARQPGRVLSRDELTHVVAGRGAEPDDRSVDVLISRLRRKIEADPKAPRLIVTMPGEGYKFTAKPQAIAGDQTTATPLSAATSHPAAKEVFMHGSPQLLEAKEGDREKSSGSIRRLPALIAAAVVVVVGLGWVAWSHRPTSQQAEVTPAQTTSQPGTSTERRASAFRRMVAAMQDDRYAWRTIERLAVEAGVEETEAREILAEHLDQVVLGKSHDGKLIARLSAR
jgi:two-component system torCAD operon response regulator TorR